MFKYVTFIMISLVHFFAINKMLLSNSNKYNKRENLLNGLPFTTNKKVIKLPIPHLFLSTFYHSILVTSLQIFRFFCNINI